MLNVARWCWNSGPLVIITAALSFSFTALAVKLIGTDVQPFETLFVSGLLCALACGSVLPFELKHAPPPANKRKRWVVWALTILRGCFGTIATCSFYLSLERLTLKDAVVLFFMSPVIASLLDWLVTGHSPGLGGAAAISLTLAGAVLVTQPPFLFHHSANGGAPAGALASECRCGLCFRYNMLITSGAASQTSGCACDSVDPIGVALALTAAAANGGGFVTVNQLRGEQPPLVLTTVYNIVLTLSTLVPMLFDFPVAPVIPKTRGVVLLLLSVSVTQFIAQLCLNRGFQLEKAGRGAAINVVQVFFSFLLDVLVLGTKPTLLSIAGGCLVAAGVLVIALTGHPSAPEAHAQPAPSPEGVDAMERGAVVEAHPKRAVAGAGVPATGVESGLTQPLLDDPDA